MARDQHTEESEKREYLRVGERMDSSKIKRPSLPYVTSEDYADYMASFSGRSGARERRRRKQRERRTPMAVRSEGREKPAAGSDQVTGGSSMKMMLRKYVMKKWIRIVTPAVAGFLAGLMVYQGFMSIYVNFKTEAVFSSPYIETIDTEGVSIRDENPLIGKLSKTSVKAVKNGDKISKGEPVINIFSSTREAASYERISEIDREIESLETMITTSEESANTVDNLGRLLDNSMVDLNERTIDGNMRDIAESRSNLSYLFNKRLVAMRRKNDFNDRIDRLTQEKTELETQISETPQSITSDYAGYYSDSTDGYETLLNFSSLSGLTVNGLQEIMKNGPSPQEDCIGKLVNTFMWYLACPVPKEEAENTLNVDSLYTLYLPHSNVGSIKATLSALNYDAEADNYLAIFVCNSFSAELCDVRTQPVKIEKCRYEGYVIKKSALHAGVKDEVHRNPRDESEFPKGHLVYVTQTTYPSVYAVVGGQIDEKEVKIVYSTDKTVICSPRHDKGDFLSLYDTVVIEERGLYDGKLIG